MPELPDVEGFRRVLATQARGRTVRRVTVPDPDALRNTSPQALGRALRNGEVGAPGRHGKWLLLPIGPALTVWHFGMTGQPVWTGDAPLHRHDRVVLRCDGGQLRLRMMRRLGGLWLVHAGEPAEAITGPLGPDALDVDVHDLHDALDGRRGGVKAALMDQRVVAGLGNLLVDEICWQARVNPRRPAADLDERDVARLHATLRDVLDTAIPTGRVPPRRGWLTGVRDTDAPRCPRDTTRLRRDTVAGRPTWWCPVCQPAD